MCAASGPPEYTLAPGEIAVRFINTPAGPDVVAAAAEGDALLRVGDSAGIRIPRQCQSGLCGSCTCDVKDESQPGGMQTIRACQTRVRLPAGCEELVVDVARMREFRSRERTDPMARFENLDTDYVAGAKPIKRGSAWAREATCTNCNGSGDVECYNCDGEGVMAEDASYECPLCAGSGETRCADCQGTGSRQVR